MLFTFEPMSMSLNVYQHSLIWKIALNAFALFQDDYVLMTQIISCPEWPPPDLPHYKAFDLLERVKELQAQKDGGPIVVVDR